MRQKITEQMVEGIYAQHQHKIETIPGYAEGFERAYHCLKKLTEPSYVVTQADQEELDRAMAELYMIEFYGWKR